MQNNIHQTQAVYHVIHDSIALIQSGHAIEFGPKAKTLLNHLVHKQKRHLNHQWLFIK